MDKKIIQKVFRYFSEEEKHRIIQDFISTQSTKVEIWKKYTGEDEEHGQIVRWMRELGYTNGIKTRTPNIVSNSNPMKKKITKPTKSVNKEVESFENLHLKNRILDLEKQLKDAELKAIAFSTMVDIAEKEFKIPIRKKFNTKP